MDDKDIIRAITLSISSELEPQAIPFSPQDFTPQNPFVKEILKTGIPLV